MTKYVVTYFALAEGDTIEEYRRWSLDYVRPVMRAMPSVVSFTDGQVVGSMDEGGPRWDAVELIEVSDFDAFERDNAEGEGGVLARLWRERLAAWSIGYIEDFLPASQEGAAQP